MKFLRYSFTSAFLGLAVYVLIFGERMNENQILGMAVFYLLLITFTLAGYFWLPPRKENEEKRISDTPYIWARIAIVSSILMIPIWSLCQWRFPPDTPGVFLLLFIMVCVLTSLIAPIASVGYTYHTLNKQKLQPDGGGNSE